MKNQIVQMDIFYLIMVVIDVQLDVINVVHILNVYNVKIQKRQNLIVNHIYDIIIIIKFINKCLLSMQSYYN